MITKEIIKIASDTKNIGLTNKYNFKSSLKNPMCGDKIKLELTIKNSKINSMKYEIESCVYCEASASLLAKKVKNLNVNSAINDINKIKEIHPYDLLAIEVIHIERSTEGVEEWIDEVTK